jgi:acetyl-CoA carboxylase biotin carboxyl carrier protein
MAPMATIPMPIPHPDPAPTSKLSSAKTGSEQIDGHAVKAPMVGTVYLSATPGAKPFVDIGQHVTVGDTICLIEAMKMFNKIEADKSGVISARLVENQQPVEFDQSLFIIDADE